MKEELSMAYKKPSIYVERTFNDLHSTSARTRNRVEGDLDMFQYINTNRQIVYNQHPDAFMKQGSLYSSLT